MAAKKKKKTAPKKKVATKKKKSTGAKKAFGGYTISFKGRKDTLEALFGKKTITPMAMTKTLWAYVKKHKLGGK